jgi:hypothetical protein
MFMQRNYDLCLLDAWFALTIERTLSEMPIMISKLIWGISEKVGRTLQSRACFPPEAEGQFPYW